MSILTHHTYRLNGKKMWYIIKYSLLYGRSVPLGHIGTGVAISAEGFSLRAYMAIQRQYDLEAHLGHIITFLIHPR